MWATLTLSESLFDGIKEVLRLQCAELLLLRCAATRAISALCVVHPLHLWVHRTNCDAGVWRCFRGCKTHHAHTP